MFELGWIERAPQSHRRRRCASPRSVWRAWPVPSGWIFPKLPIMRDVVVDGSALTIDDVVAVAHGQARVRLGDDVPKRMEVSRSVVVEALRGNAPVYGVNTGFGALADTPVGEADLTTLQGAIVRSHAAAIGAPLDDETVRAILLLRARTLAAGYSGVRADLPAGSPAALPRPAAGHPGQGLGGRLGRPGPARAPGPAADRGGAAALARRSRGRRPAAEVLREHGLEPLTLAPKEGLSLVNGTEPMQALLAFSVHDAAMLVERPTWPADFRLRRCSAPTGPTTSGSRGSGRIRGSWSARPTCAGCWPGRRCWPATGTAGTRCRTPTACAARRRCTARSGTCSPSHARSSPPSWARWWTTRSSCPTARS